MPRIYTLSNISEGKKLGGIPSSRYPPNRIELENQLACANRDRKIAIECGNQLVNKCSSKTRGFATDTSSAIIPDNTDNERTSIPEES
ncbi:17615_t:CDS:2, partial [Entrophospora sp. SA101]